MDLGNGTRAGVCEVIDHDAIGLCPRWRKMNGILEGGAFLWVEVLEASRE